ncbi:hypothetical protein THTE_3568 [Thermogutta terrifontis]|uniref:Uncharacterized protein n=1 Tax=Thermogutta terrifontis TaxID=1331910 RepID=A0A286RJM4_9BACT|nr:hypothetical protein THTE_3568 [Thermogutta terrifontis]
MLRFAKVSQSADWTLVGRHETADQLRGFPLATYWARPRAIFIFAKPVTCRERKVLAGQLMNCSYRWRRRGGNGPSDSRMIRMQPVCLLGVQPGPMGGTPSTASVEHGRAHLPCPVSLM